MEITGKVIQILAPQEGVSRSTGSPWKSQSFIIETLDRYPRKVAIDMFGEERISKNLPQLNDTVTVSYDLESREFNNRWYTSVMAWKVESETANAGTPVPPPEEDPEMQALFATQQ